MSATCPVCGGNLFPSKLTGDVWDCQVCGEPWHYEQLRIAAATRRARELALLERVKAWMPDAPEHFDSIADAGYARCANDVHAIFIRIRAEIEGQ